MQGRKTRFTLQQTPRELHSYSNRYDRSAELTYRRWIIGLFETYEPPPKPYTE
jgi:hypothetical protein